MPLIASAELTTAHYEQPQFIHKVDHKHLVGTPGKANKRK